MSVIDLAAMAAVPLWTIYMIAKELKADRALKRTQ